MKNLITVLFTLLFYSFIYGQTARELFKKKDYQAIIKLEEQGDKLTADELYLIGFAFYKMENDKKAIEFYDKAIAKVPNNGTLHFYKGLSLRYLQKYEEALKEIELSLKLEPTNQEYMNEKGLIYYYQEKLDKALEIFEEAKKLPRTFPQPFFWAARIYHEKKEFNKALSGFYEALKNIPSDNTYYYNSLESIGQLEYTVTKDYLKSAKAYSQAIQMDKENYELYYRLMKSYNAAKQFSKADSVFSIVKIAFEKGKLPKDDMELKTVAVAQFEWNGQIVTVRKSLIEPKEKFDISYKVFLQNKEGDKIERRFVVEKMKQIVKDGGKHVLCEQDKKNSRHITYPYGWTTDNIPLDDLQDAIILVLDGKMEEGASSPSNYK